jgi:hypothetical protein
MTTDWITANLPYSDIPEGMEIPYPTSPDTSEQERALFGMTSDEALNALDGNARIECDAALLAEFEESHPESDYEGPSFEEFRREEWPKRIPEVYAKYAKYWEICDWLRAQPEDPEWKATCESVTAQNNQLTFQGRGLAQPGTQIEMADGKRYLIGDINTNRGVCDDCVAFDGNAIVVRYRVLIMKGEMMEIETTEEISRYQREAMKRGACVQCVNPWYDGLCECTCPPTKNQDVECDRILQAALAFEKEYGRYPTDSEDLPVMLNTPEGTLENLWPTDNSHE